MLVGHDVDEVVLLSLDIRQGALALDGGEGVEEAKSLEGRGLSRSETRRAKRMLVSTSDV